MFIGKDLASGRDVGGGLFRDKKPTSLSGALWYSNEQPSSNMSKLSYGALKKQGTWSPVSVMPMKPNFCATSSSQNPKLIPELQLKALKKDIMIVIVDHFRR